MSHESATGASHSDEHGTPPGQGGDPPGQGGTPPGQGPPGGDPPEPPTPPNPVPEPCPDKPNPWPRRHGEYRWPLEPPHTGGDPAHSTRNGGNDIDGDGRPESYSGTIDKDGDNIPDARLLSDGTIRDLPDGRKVVAHFEVVTDAPPPKFEDFQPPSFRNHGWSLSLGSLGGIGKLLAIIALVLMMLGFFGQRFGWLRFGGGYSAEVLERWITSEQHRDSLSNAQVREAEDAIEEDTGRRVRGLE